MRARARARLVPRECRPSRAEPGQSAKRRHGVLVPQKQIDAMTSVEDTKGNNGEKGTLAITNLRLIWICQKQSRINLSVGYAAVVSINIRNANSRLRGNTQALYVMTKFNTSRFEFVFTNLVRASPRLFTTVQVGAASASGLAAAALLAARPAGRAPRLADAAAAGRLPRVRHVAIVPRPQVARRHHQEQEPTAVAGRADVQPGERRVESVFGPGQPWHVLHHQRAPRLARQPG